MTKTPRVRITQANATDHDALADYEQWITSMYGPREQWPDWITTPEWMVVETKRSARAARPGYQIAGFMTFEFPDGPGKRCVIRTWAYRAERDTWTVETEDRKAGVL